MKNIASFKLMMFFGLCFFTNVVFGQSEDYVPGQVLVKWKSDKSITQKSALKKSAKANTIKTFPKQQFELWEIDAPTNVSKIVDTYRQHPDIEFIEPNYLYSTTTSPDDPLAYNLWGMSNTGQTGGTSGADANAAEAWKILTGSPNIVVAIIDTGIDWTHEDLVNNIWQNLAEDADGDGKVLEWNGSNWVFDSGDQNGIDDDGNGYIDDFVGWDFVNNDNNPYDDHGHGTHVAGTVGAQGNNSKGVSGVTWDVQLAALKFLSGSGSGSTADAIEALDYAVSMGIRISNNSWGGGAYSNALFNSLTTAQAEDHLFVAAAGNNYGSNNDNYPRYPTSYSHNNIISVASINHYDLLSYFSNYGATSVDIGAPGSDILSCKPGNAYASNSGTSMAAPHVAGACALLWGLYPNKNHAQIKEAVLNSTTSTPALINKTVSGGRLDVHGALNYFGTPIIGSCRNHDSLILATLYENTNGENWLNSWNLNSPIDQWYGVALNEKGCLDSLKLNQNNLTGTLPTQIGNLSEPRGIYFGKNDINGEIPASIGNLSTLVGLNLANNNFSGNVPPEFFTSLTNLTFLGISSNPISGALPPEIANLTNMKYLYVGNTDASGPLPPEIGSLTELRILQIINSGFSGALPLEMANLTKLEALYIINNDFSGQIPQEFTQFVNLNDFRCQGNDFNFDSFEGFENFNASTFYYVLQDSLPLIVNGNILSIDAGGNVADNTYSWFRNGNPITSIIGDSTLTISQFGNYRCEVSNTTFTNSTDENQNLILTSKERYVFPSGNLTCRQNDSLILVTLYNTTNGNNWKKTWDTNIPLDQWHGVVLNQNGCLDSLLLNHNALTGTLPAELGNLAGPRGLYFGANEITGEIPSELGKLTTLVGLNIADNNFTGSVPLEIYDLINLTFLGYTGNPLSGPVAPEIGNLVNMLYLYIGRTNASGPLPPEIGNLTELRILQMRENGFTGTLPAQVANWTKLQYLDISKNEFTGAIPVAWSNYSDLTDMICPLNKFTFDSFDTTNIPDSYHYAPQDSIPISINGNMLSVNAGGTTSDNTYNWYKDGLLVQSNTGNNSYTYSSTGTYWCEIINSSITKPDKPKQNLILTSKRIQVLVNCDAQAGFMPESGAKCMNSTYTFTNTSTGTSDYVWEVNGVEVATTQNLIYTFTSYGNYTVTLRVSGNGCEDEYSQTFYVSPSASDLYFGPDIYVCDVEVEIIANVPNMAWYSWDLNGTQVGNTPSIVVTTPGNYVLSVQDSCGMVNLDTINVNLATGCVWPGDFDNNGIVNAYDLIPAGVAFGATGGSRPNATLEWQPQPAPTWSGSQTDGTNYNHIDGDGNGIIDLDDPAAIDANYGKVHAVSNSSAYPQSTDFVITPEVSIQAANNNKQLISINLKLENPTGKPVYSFVGSYNYSAIGNTASIDFSNSLFGVQNMDFIVVQRDYDGRIEFAITLTNTSTSLNIVDIGTLNVLDEYYSNGDEGPQSGGQVILEQNLVGDSNGNLVDIGEQIISLVYDEESEVGANSTNNNSLALVTYASLSDCYGLADARIEVLSGTPPYLYEWSDGQTSEVATNLGVGNYNFTVTDAAGLVKVGAIGIQPGNGVWLQSTVKPSTTGQNDGTATVYASGGDGNYTYKWSNGANTPMLQYLSPGIYFVTVTDGSGCSMTESVNISGDGVQLSASLLLEGALKDNHRIMTTDLHRQSVLPLEQPYGGQTDYYKKETSNLLIFDKGHIVDWVIVELRDKDDYELVSGKRVGLLLANGKIADMDGSSPLLFSDIPQDDYYVYIKHRNHLPIMSASPVTTVANVMNIDFRVTDSYSGLGASQKEVVPGVWTMYSGDVNDDRDINGVDKLEWSLQNGNFGKYSSNDLNLDADINGSDKDYWSRNNGYSSGTPK